MQRSHGTVSLQTTYYSVQHFAGSSLVAAWAVVNLKQLVLHLAISIAWRVENLLAHLNHKPLKFIFGSIENKFYILKSKFWLDTKHK